MSEAPETLPPTEAERLAVITSRMPGGSYGGETRYALDGPFQGPPPEPFQQESDTVITGTGSPDSVSITSTEPGEGSSDASGQKSIAVGVGSKALADESVAIGYNAEVPAESSFGNIVIGFGSTAGSTEAGCVALGLDCHADAPASIAIGIGVTTTIQGEIAIGGEHSPVIVRLLVLPDGAGGYWQLVVDGSGALSTVPFSP